MSKELAIQKRELVWPPQNTTDLMAFFIEKEKNDLAFKGMADCADYFVQTLFKLAKTPDDEIIKWGNAAVELKLTPEGSDITGPASEALIDAAYALTGAELIESRESLRTNKRHLLYEGILPVNQNGSTRYLPLAFKETYRLDKEGGFFPIEWGIRTNYPQREQIERLAFQDEQISPDQRLEWRQSVLTALGQVRVIEVPIPEERYPRAA